MSFDALEQIVKQAGTDGHGFFRAIMEEDMEERQVSREESFGKMQQMYAAMRASDAAYDRSSLWTGARGSAAALWIRS